MSETLWAGWLIKQPPKKPAADSADKRNHLAIQKRAKQEEWVVVWISKEAPHLLEGSKEASPSNELIDRLLAEIDLAKGEKRRWRRNFLLRALNRGARELGWPSFPHQPIIKLWLRGSPINSTTFPYITKFTKLREIFSKHWKAQGNQAPFVGPVASDSAEGQYLRQGQILLSAILFGGIASRARLAGVAQHALSRLDAFGDFVWVDWPENTDDADSSWQRWLPDQTTGLLLARALVDGINCLFSADEKIAPEKRAWAAVDNFLASLNLPKENRPTSLRMIFDWASTWHFRHLPPFLAACANEELESSALPPHVWLRHLQQRAIPAPSSGARTVSTITNTVNEKPYRPTVMLNSDLDEPARKLRNILRGKSQESTPATKKPSKTAKQIRQNLSQFIAQEDIPAILQLLSGWVSTRISRGSPTQSAISVALAQLESIDRLLIDAVGFDDILSYSGDRLMSVYISVIDASQSAKRHNLRVAALGGFQRYLERIHGFSEIANSLFDELPDNGRVDANFFSPAHYQSVLIQLSPANSRYSPAKAAMHQIALILSFRMGLRRGEILRLRLDDVRGDIHPMIVVRHRPGETLKSDNAVRVIPLSTLLTKTELANFQAYLAATRERLRWQNHKDSVAIDETAAYLFPNEQDFCQPMSESGLFNPIEETLRENTGDARIRLHHGRHGAINLLALHLLENILPGCSAPFIESTELGQFEQLQEQIIGTRDPSRQHLWAVAVLAGHGSPEITFGSYFHLCDWLLHFALRNHPASHLDISFVAQFLGLSYQKVISLQRQLGLTQTQWVPIILSALPRFKDCWPSEQLFSNPHNKAGASTNASSLFAEEVPKATIPKKTAHSILTTQGGLLNACQVLNLLNDLDSLFSKKISPGMKSKQANGAIKNIEGVAKKHQISLEQADLLWKATQQMAQIRGNSGLRKHRLSHIPNVAETLRFDGFELKRPIPRARPVLNKKERDSVNAIFWQLESMWFDDQAQLNNWISLHWQHWREDRHALRFGHQAPCIAWLEVIRQLAAFSDTGVALDRINLIHEANGRAGKLPPEHQLDRWIEALALSAATFSSGESLQKPKGESGDGIIEISFPIQFQTSNAWVKQRVRKNIVAERKRSSSLALDAAAYVLTIEIAMLELSERTDSVTSATDGNSLE